MKKKICAVIAGIMVLGMFAGCGSGGKAEDVPEIVGTWESKDDLFEEEYEFKKDGTGHYENVLLPYDFEYEIDGDQLNIYSKILGELSDTPDEYTYSISGDTLTLSSDVYGDYEYVRK